MPETPLRSAASEREVLPSAVPLMQIATGFWASKMLAAAVELELFTRISRTGADTADLGRVFGLHPRPAEMLLSACAALGFLIKRDGRFFNAALTEEYLVKGKPTYFGGLVTMLDRRLYLPFHRLIETEGRNYCWTEYEAWLTEAGFCDLARVPIDSPGANGILVGYRP